MNRPKKVLNLFISFWYWIIFDIVVLFASFYACPRKNTMHLISFSWINKLKISSVNIPILLSIITLTVLNVLVSFRFESVRFRSFITEENLWSLTSLFGFLQFRRVLLIYTVALPFGFSLLAQKRRKQRQCPPLIIFHHWIISLRQKRSIV